MPGTLPLTGSLDRVTYHTLNTRSSELAIKESQEGLTNDESWEKADLDAEISLRNRESEQHGHGFIHEGLMARWGIDYSDCIG